MAPPSLTSFVPCATAALLAMHLVTAAAVSDQRQSRSAPAPLRPDESVIVDIPASSPWTDTGVIVGPGDRVAMRAWGRVRYADTRGGAAAALINGPAGAGPGGGCAFVVTDARVPADALIANIAPQLTLDGAGVLAGTALTATLPIAGSSAPEGRLFLGVNHGGILCDRSGFDSWSFRNGGSGAFTAQLTISRRR